MSKSLNAVMFTSGITVTGGIGFAAYKYIESKQTNKQTYLVKAEEVSVANIKGLNYFCSLNQESDDCKIISFKFNKQQYVDLKRIIETKTPTEKLTQNSFYKLLINANKMKTELENNVTQIIITNKEQKEIAKLKIISLIDNTKPNNPIDLDKQFKFLVKSNNNFFGYEEFNSKCKSSAQNGKSINCQIYKLEDSSHKNLFDFSKIKKIKKFNEIQSSGYYVVDLSDANKNDFDEKNINKIFIDNSDKETVEFSFITKIITNIEEPIDNLTNLEALILLTVVEQNTFKNTYIIVKSEATTEEGFVPGENKNYSCVVNDLIDNNCSIISLKDDAKSLSSITSSNSEPKNLKEENKYYKIIVGNEIISKIEMGDNKFFDVIDRQDQQKKYGKLKILFLIENGIPTRGEVNWVIGNISKISDEWNQHKEKNFECLLSIGQKDDCHVYKFEDSKATLDNIFQHSNKKLTKVEKIKDLQKNSLYLIDLKGLKFDISDSIDDLYFLNKEGDSTKNVAELKMDIPLINKSVNGVNIDKTIILK